MAEDYQTFTVRLKSVDAQKVRKRAAAHGVSVHMFMRKRIMSSTQQEIGNPMARQMRDE